MVRFKVTQSWQRLVDSPIIDDDYKIDAEVAELVDAPDLGSGAARCESSSLSFRTIF